MKRFAFLTCMIFGQLTAIEVIPNPTLADRLSYFAQNLRDFADMRPQAAATLVVALVTGSGYCLASYFDCLPAAIPSVSNVKKKICKALPEQTPGVVVGEIWLGLIAVYFLQDLPAFIGSWFENPLPDGA